MSQGLPCLGLVGFQSIGITKVIAIEIYQSSVSFNNFVANVFDMFVHVRFPSIITPEYSICDSS